MNLQIGLLIVALVFIGVMVILRWLSARSAVQELGQTNLDSLAVLVGMENFGLPSVISADITYESSGAVFTIPDGEIWIVHGAILNVTTNFDCTGDDCALDLGDGGDADGLLNCADADLQAAAADYTGAAAGWQGLDGAAPMGAYLVGGPHVYAPSGADETIDVDIAGTDPAAGAATVYLIYTRIQ